MRISDWSSDVCSSDLVAVAEAGYAAVLQKPADDALDPDVVRQAADARPQAADAADHEIDLHAGLGRAVQPVDDLVIDQGIQLRPDMPGPPLGGMLHFLLDVLYQGLQIGRASCRERVCHYV